MEPQEWAKAEKPTQGEMDTRSISNSGKTSVLCTFYLIFTEAKEKQKLHILSSPREKLHQRHRQFNRSLVSQANVKERLPQTGQDGRCCS